MFVSRQEEDIMHYGSGRDYSSLPKVLRVATKELREHLDEFDALICTGISGLVVASPLSVRLKKPLMVLRKQGEDCHGNRLEPLIGYKEHLYPRILFVDDFVGCGDTRERCIDAVAKKSNRRAKIVAQYEYDPYMGDPGGWQYL
jgi:adenine/guanine phosphoribosyltransferase-like PRPP-binding protein